MRVQVILLELFIWILITGYALDSYDYESKLREDLLKDLPTDVVVRPMPTKNTTDIRTFMLLTHILGLDEKTETLTVNGWMFLIWDDERLQWDPAKYGGLTNLRIPEHSVWKPRLVPFNSASFSEAYVLFSVARPIVNFAGWVRWVPAFTSDTICAMDFKFFPFDVHNCSISFASWYENGNVLNVTLPEFAVRDLMVEFGDVHNEWELLSSGGEIEIMNPGSYYQWYLLKYYLVLRRTAPYYQLTLVVPSVVGVIITLAIFWIPVNCQSLKYTVALFNICFLTILSVQIYRVVPRSGDSIPGILVLTGNTLALAGVSVLFSVVISHLSQRVDPIPHLIQKHLNGPLAVGLCLRLPKTNDAEESLTANEEAAENSQMEVGDPWSETAKKKLNRSQWMIIATVVERILFAVYALTFFITLIVAFA